MLATTLLTIWLTIAIYTVRHRSIRDVRQAWGSARPWERCVLALAVIPIPGPFDELAAAMVMARITRRTMQSTLTTADLAADLQVATVCPKSGMPYDAHESRRIPS